MRPFLLFTLLLSSVSCAQRASNDSIDMTCVERLELPSFPSIADSARVEAGVTAAVQLTQDGKIETVSMGVGSGMEYAAKLFYPAVEKAMKASTFLPSCGGKTVHLAFEFPFPTRSETGETVQTVRFKNPNRFEIALTPAPSRWYTVQQGD
jgi:hypothetical protein